MGIERDLSSEEVTSMDQAAFNTTTQWTTFGEDDQLHTKVIKDVTIISKYSFCDLFSDKVMHQRQCASKDQSKIIGD